MENVKRIPYGVSDFVDIIKRNQYYVDKTMYIPKLEEEADSLFFIRPRRFGKSLLLSMMCAYYDITSLIGLRNCSANYGLAPIQHLTEESFRSCSWIFLKSGEI